MASTWARVFTSTPVYPYFSTFKSRYDSFQLACALPNAFRFRLAAAGFFYSSYSTSTICFYCGGTVPYWDWQEDPVLVHLLLCSYCPRNCLTLKTLTFLYKDYINK